jgi:hypothetical protein
MQFNITYIYILAILGIILLYSYYYLFVNYKNSYELWGKIKGNLLNVYYVSMLLSTIGFLFLFYYLNITNIFNTTQINKIFISLVCIVVISMLWMPLSLQYLTKKNDFLMYQILLVLFLVSLSALYVVILLYNIKETEHKTSKLFALIGMIYFFIHAFFFDFITWSRNFF